MVIWGVGGGGSEGSQSLDNIRKPQFWLSIYT